MIKYVKNKLVNYPGIYFTAKYGVYVLFRMPCNLYFKILQYLRRKNVVTHSRYFEIKKYHNIYCGKRCFIVATGPSLTMEDLDKIKGEISFGMNSIVLSFGDTAWRPTFYGIQDGSVYQKLEDKIIHSGMEKILCGISDPILTPNIKCDHIPFPLFLSNHTKDNRYHGSSFSDDCYQVVYDGYSITYSLLQIACYMGFKEIYLLGLDCNYDSGGKSHVREYNTEEDQKMLIKSNIMEYMKKSYEVAKKFAESKDIKIYNVSRNTALSIFEKKDLDTVLRGE